MAVTLVASRRFVDHETPPGHPDSPARAEAMGVVARRWAARGGGVVEPRPATLEELRRVHAPSHVEAVMATVGRATSFDSDTYTSPASAEVACLAAGAGLVALDRALEYREIGLALVRPPGHHAERDRAMGFCLFNNVAVVAAEAMARGVPRLAIVDFDVHHGNGTQWTFYDDPRVLYLSIHQYPFYPGTGAVGDVGRGDGRGFTVNLPLEAGATDGDYALLFGEIVVPILRAFGAPLLLVSAGYDAHVRDPLGGMRVSTVGFAGMVHRLREAVGQDDGALVLITEGGYDLPALTAALDATIATLDVTDPDPLPQPGGVTSMGRDGLAAALAVQRVHWPTL